MSQNEKVFKEIVANSLTDVDAIGDGVDLTPRSVPTEFTSFPLGHIAFMGDFDNSDAHRD